MPDHLKCYKITDPQPKASYTADLSGLTLEAGCVIKVPAKLACVPATKTNVTPTPPGGGGSGIPNSFFCYKVKCPKATLSALPGADQFGSRTVTPSVAKLPCAPLAGPSTTTTSTTTTTLRFVDNGDGTVTDHQTGLQWEKKVAGSGCLHCVDDTDTWSATPFDTAPDGTAFTSFLNTLNGGATGVGNCVSTDGTTITGGFNGHCDWRLPTVVELNSIFDPGAPGCGSGPCIAPVFGPTAASFYWSSITVASDEAWAVHFGFPGVAQFYTKNSSLSVRAVRGGITTMPACFIGSGCGSSCSGNGVCLTHQPDNAPECVNLNSCSGTSCSSDANCSSGASCFAYGSATSCCSSPCP